MPAARRSRAAARGLRPACGAAAAASAAPVEETLAALRAGLPFMGSEGLAAVCDARVRYEFLGQLDKSSGVDDLVRRHAAWGGRLEERLGDVELEPGSLSVLRADAREVVARQSYTASFRARVPPPAIARLEEIGQLEPGGFLPCRITVQSDFTIDGATGKLLAQNDALVDEAWDVPGTIARTEFLLARRPPSRDAVTWYWDVLRLQTRDEWSAAGYPTQDNGGKDFEFAFASMIARQFAIGGGIGICIFAASKVLKSILLSGGAVGGLGGGGGGGF
uniref:Uncharacterized protein n=1 Tax=Phaeomonas parva TaxID=124430 RepID=A0A7S1U6E6_9STRA